MKIKLLKAYSTYTPGTVVDCEDGRAAQLIRDGIAEREHQAEVIETAAVEPVAERADLTPKRTRRGAVLQKPSEDG